MRSYKLINHKLNLLPALIGLLLCPFTLNAEKYVFKVGQFNKLSVLDNVNVIYSCVPDSTGCVTYTGSEDFEDAFILTNKKGKLIVQVITEDAGKKDLPTLKVYSDYLNKVENSGNCTVRVNRPAPCPNFKAKVIGNGTLIINDLQATSVEAAVVAGMGKVVISGECTDSKYRITGTGSIIADRLKATDTKIVLTLGTGYIGCWTTGNLNVGGLGSTKIYYKGDPVIKKKGNAKLFRLPEEDFTMDGESGLNTGELDQIKEMEEEDETVLGD